MITKKIADSIIKKYDNFYKKEIIINNTKLYLYNYILSDYDVFQNEPLSKELRGLIITEEPQKIFLSVPKFFNINETEETHIKNIKHQEIRKVQEKLDGSLITPILIAGEIFCKSKASFESPQAKMAQEIVDDSTDLKYFILDCFSNDFQPFFELTGKDNQHVLEQDHEKRLTLIMVRDQEGHFIDVDKFNYKYTAKSYEMSWDELLAKQETEKGIEGWVVKYGKKSENIIKVKTKEFFELHKIHEESDSYKIILKRILEEDLDDILSIVSEKKKEELKEINDLISDYVSHWTLFCYENSRGRDRKTTAQKFMKHEFFSVIMSSINKSNIEDIKKLVIKHTLMKNNKEEKAKAFIKKLKG